MYISVWLGNFVLKVDIHLYISWTRYDLFFFIFFIFKRGLFVVILRGHMQGRKKKQL